MNPVGILFLLFLLVPLVEIYFLIKVGSLIGAIPTIALVVFTALLGAMLLRFQGWATVQRTRTTMARGELPALEMLEGVLLLFAGALLLTTVPNDTTSVYTRFTFDIDGVVDRGHQGRY